MFKTESSFSMSNNQRNFPDKISKNSDVDLKWQNVNNKSTHCEKRVRISLYSVQMQENRTKKSPNTDTFHAVTDRYMFLISNLSN